MILVPFHRLLQGGTHFWTSDPSELAALIGQGWTDEGGACYVAQAPTPPLDAMTAAELVAWDGYASVAMRQRINYGLRPDPPWACATDAAACADALIVERRKRTG